jgi:hypothetical protein
MQIVNRLSIRTAVAVVLVLAAGFIAGRSFHRSPSVAAEPADQTPPPGDATPVPGATPDTSKDFWYLPYQAKDDSLPRYSQTVSGIALGPNVRSEYACVLEDETSGPSAGSPLVIDPGYLPAGAKPDNADQYSGCGGAVAASDRSWIIRTDEADMETVKSGDKTFFQARHGGSVEVFRVRELAPSFQTTFPSGRFTAATLAGRPAAFGPPLFEDGWGAFELYVWDPTDSVLTVVRGTDLSSSDIIKVAEGLFTK